MPDVTPRRPNAARAPLAFLAAIAVVLSLGCADTPLGPERVHQPQLAKGGNGGGGKPGGGGGGADPVLVFRDAASDRLGSDDGSSYAGAFESAGFIVSFGRRSARFVSMDFGTQLLAGEVAVPAHLADGAERPSSLEVYRDDGSGSNLPLEAMTAGQSSDARMSVYFDDPDDRKAEWILSMANKSAGWFGTITCLADDGSACTVWRVAPGGDERLRLLRNLTTSAGEYAMPFEAVLCALPESDCRTVAGY